jgi:hypothetical protein
MLSFSNLIGGTQFSVNKKITNESTHDLLYFSEVQKGMSILRAV